MNRINTLPTGAEDPPEHAINRESFVMHPRTSITNNHDRLAELESENSRLHRLVAELLIKNQQLRRPR
jgi:hypothetical protein